VGAGLHLIALTPAETRDRVVAFRRIAARSPASCETGGGEPCRPATAAATCLASRRLPHPPGPLSVTTRLREHRDGAGQVAVATDERADRHDGRAGRGAGAEGPAGSCVPQRLPVQRAQLRRRVQTQLLRQLVAQPAVGAQRIAGSPRSHQPADEYRDRAFAQRLGGHQRFGRDHRLTGAASGEQRLGPLFDGGGPQAGETGDLGLDVGVVELGERPATPERECRVELGEPAAGPGSCAARARCAANRAASTPSGVTSRR
jgi:hypothetical protein